MAQPMSGWYEPAKVWIKIRSNKSISIISVTFLKAHPIKKYQINHSTGKTGIAVFGNPTSTFREIAIFKTACLLAQSLPIILT